MGTLLIQPKLHCTIYFRNQKSRLRKGKIGGKKAVMTEVQDVQAEVIWD